MRPDADPFNPSDPSRPLLILDADEVLLAFVEALEGHLKVLGYELRLTSFQLSGNIYKTGSNEPATAGDVGEMIKDFFAHKTDTLQPVPGAVEALSELGAICDIVILSNVPAERASTRQKNLAGHGINHPLIANEGGKGDMAAKLAAARTGFVGFVDDLPPQHSSVKAAADHIHRVHLVADTRLRPLLPPAPDAHVRIDPWDQACAHLLRQLARY